MQPLLCLLTLLPLTIQALPFSISPGSWATQEIPTNQRRAREAARVAVHYLNYYTGSPHQLQTLAEVKKATVKSVPEIGNKYYLEFTTKDFQTNENLGLCTATVFFQNSDKPRPAVNVNCSNNKSMKKAREDDYNFYKTMRKQTTPISGGNIPDSFGNVKPEFEPLWYLGIMGSSYAMWEKSTENRHYNMAQIKNLKQMFRKDDLISFDYDVLLHEVPTQRMVTCSFHVVWIPGKPPKVEYKCSSDSEEDGSGSESDEGSTFLGNFK
ncbi:retinoic acid receptor responder protein 1 [Discoglossus pictus]